MIRKVKIIGTERPITFSMATLLRFGEETGRDVNSIFTGVPPLKVTEVYKLMYLALKSGAEDSNEIFSLTFGDFTNQIYTDLKGFEAAWAVLQGLIKAMVEAYAQIDDEDIKESEVVGEKKIAK